MTLLSPDHPDYIARPFGADPSLMPHLYAYASDQLPRSQKAEHRKDGLPAQARVLYQSERFPWIMAMHRFPILNAYPTQWDIARFEVPPGSPPGRYILYYAWRGYRDCVDIDVLPDSKPVPNTPRAIYGYRPEGMGTYGGTDAQGYVKTDHCQYPAPYMLATRRAYIAGVDNRRYRPPLAEGPNDGGGVDGVADDGVTTSQAAACVAGTITPSEKYRTCFAIPPEGALNSRGQNASEALDKCMERCSYASTINFPVDGGSAYCFALNVVPLAPPPRILFPDEQNIPWGTNDCTPECFADEPAGSKICYGLREYNARAVDPPWDLAQDDPTDEVFYSTCFRVTFPWAFDGPRCGADCETPPRPPPWRFGEHCLSCANAERAQNATLPDWTLADKCTMCHRPEVTPYNPPPPPPPPAPPAPPSPPPPPLPPSTGCASPP